MNCENFEKAVAFHGHACPGLAIGVKACEAAEKALGITRAADEELVCITENDACGVDAIQALLGCTMGKGNLIYKGTGKHAYTFVNRKTGRAVRLYYKGVPDEMPRAEKQAYILGAPTEALFTCTEVAAPAPEKARLFRSVACAVCGEAAPEHKMRLQNGEAVCLDCFEDYGRGW